MGIYGVKSKTCGCKGSWSTLDSEDTGVYISRPCSQHELVRGNTFFYDLGPLLKLVAKPIYFDVIQPVYALKIIDVVEDNTVKLLKVELKNFNVTMFNESKQQFFSQINDEPMFQQFDETTVHFIFKFLPKFWTVEEGWDPDDY